MLVRFMTDMWLSAEGVSKVRQQARERQQQAAVQLKHHIDQAQTDLAQKAEVHQTRAKQRAEMHAKSFNSLLDSGQNPYAVRLTPTTLCCCYYRTVFEYCCEMK